VCDSDDDNDDDDDDMERHRHWRYIECAAEVEFYNALKTLQLTKSTVLNKTCRARNKL